MTLPSTDRTTHVDWSAAPPCPFAKPDQWRKLKPRESCYWHAVAMCRHIGVYRPNRRVCTWVARVLTVDGRYIQKRLAPAHEGHAEAVEYDEALRRAIVWFEGKDIRAIAQSARPIGRAEGLNFCPFGTIYTVGAALADYLEWSQIARSPGSHYNSIVLINYHLSGPVLFEPLEEFNARHLRGIVFRRAKLTP